MTSHHDKPQELTLETVPAVSGRQGDLEGHFEDEKAKDRDMTAAEMTDIQRSEALASAQLQDPGVDYRSKNGIKLLLILLACLVCGSDTAFDGGGKSNLASLSWLIRLVMSSINSMQPFLDYFGFEQANKSTGIIFGVYTIGESPFSN